MKTRLRYNQVVIFITAVIALTMCCEKRADGIVMASDVYEECDEDYIVGRVFPNTDDTADYKSLIDKTVLVESILLDNEDYIRGFDYYLTEDDEWFLSYYFRQYSFDLSENGHEIAVLQMIWVHSDKPEEEKAAREDYAKEPLLMIEDGGESVIDIYIDLTDKKITSVFFHDET